MSNQIVSPELAQYLGMKPEEITNLDQFKEKFNQSFVSKTALTDPKSSEYQEFAPKAVGRIAGVIENLVGKTLKTVGLELTEEEKKKPVESLVETALSRLRESGDAKVNQLAEQLKSNASEKEKQLADQLTGVQKKYKDLEGLHHQTVQQLEQERTEAASKIREVQIGFQKTDIESKTIRWRNGIKPVEQEGFFSLLGKQVKLDLDDQGKLIVLDKDGKLINSKKRTGTFMTYEEILEEQGKAAGIWEENPHARNQPPVPRGTFTPPASTTPPAGGATGQPQRRLAKDRMQN
ncbi:MAG: hypothetical protein ACO1HP_07520 [Bacteroidota bacterium]